MSAETSSVFEISRDRELERIVSLQQASRLMGRRRHADKILQLSPRRQGMRLRDALLKSKD